MCQFTNSPYLDIHLSMSQCSQAGSKVYTSLFNYKPKILSGEQLSKIELSSPTHK